MMWPDLLLGADAAGAPGPGRGSGHCSAGGTWSLAWPVICTDVCGYAHHIAAAKAGMVLRSPFLQEDLNTAVLRSLDGVYRSQCRETGLTYAQLTDLYSMHSNGAALIEAAIAHKQEARND